MLLQRALTTTERPILIIRLSERPAYAKLQTLPLKKRTLNCRWRKQLEAQTGPDVIWKPYVIADTSSTASYATIAKAGSDREKQYH